MFRKPSNYANGNTRDRQGRPITGQHRTRSVTRTESDGSLTTLIDRFDGKPLNAPDDGVCHSDGALWFADPAFGPNPHATMAAPALPGHVHRIDPQRGADLCFGGLNRTRLLMTATHAVCALAVNTRGAGTC